MHKISTVILLLCTSINTLIAAPQNASLQLPYGEENATARKLQHWYKHRCWKAIESFYLSNKNSIEGKEQSACLPIVALSYCAQEDFDTADRIATTFFQSSSQASPSQLNAMHAIALKCAMHKKDLQAAKTHYNSLIKDRSLSSLPLWAKYTLADTALQCNDNKKVVDILLPSYQQNDKDDPFQPRIALLLGIAQMRMKNPEEAYQLFLECYQHPEAGTLAGIAAKGRIRTTQDILKHAVNEKKTLEEQKLLFDLQALINDRLSISNEEKSAALKQQADLLAQFLKFNATTAHLSRILDMSIPPTERALGELQIAFNAYLTGKDFKTFHKFAQGAIKTDKELATLKALRLALFQIYDTESKNNPALNEIASEQLIAAYPLGNPPTEPHQKSALRLAQNIYNTLIEPPKRQFCLLNLPPPEEKRAALAADLFALAKDYEKSIFLYASLHDVRSLLSLEPHIKDPKQKDLLNAVLAYLNAHSGQLSDGCTRGVLAMASPDPQIATLASLAYAASAWRLLAAQKNPNPDDFLPLFELLDRLQTNKHTETEPWHIEAALEYILASSFLLEKEPNAALQSAMLADRMHAKAFDQTALDHKEYWEEIHQNKRLQQLIEHYSALFQALSAKFHAQDAAQKGQMDEMLGWQRQLAENSKEALGNHQYLTPLILTESLSKPRN